MHANFEESVSVASSYFFTKVQRSSRKNIYATYQNVARLNCRTDNRNNKRTVIINNVIDDAFRKPDFTA